MIDNPDQSSSLKGSEEDEDEPARRHRRSGSGHSRSGTSWTAPSRRSHDHRVVRRWPVPAAACLFSPVSAVPAVWRVHPARLATPVPAVPAVSAAGHDLWHLRDAVLRRAVAYLPDAAMPALRGAVPGALSRVPLQVQCLRRYIQGVPQLSGTLRLALTR